jgi:hypothetical protein
MTEHHKEQLSSQAQRQIRERAVQYFFPNSGLKPTSPGSVLYRNREGLVAHVSTAQHSGDGDVRFWYGFRMNHLASISKARQAFFVARGFIDKDRCMYFSFPCSANDQGETFICGRPLLSKTGKSHFNVELTQSGNGFLLNIFDGGELINATPFAVLR